MFYRLRLRCGFACVRLVSYTEWMCTHLHRQGINYALEMGENFIFSRVDWFFIMSQVL